MRRLLVAFLKLFLSKKFLQERRIRLAHMPLQRYGDEALSILTNCFNDLNVNFYIMFGTLLGAYREHGFIQHDDDLDVMCDSQYLSRELIHSLQGSGFEINKIYVSSDKIGIQVPMKYKGLTCDIYFSYSDSNLDCRHIYIPWNINNKNWDYSVNCNLWSVCDVNIPSINSCVSIDFNKHKINIPCNSREILKKIYGEDYMMPIKSKKLSPTCFSLSEKYFSCFPLEVFLNSNMLEKVHEKATSL